MLPWIWLNLRKIHSYRVAKFRKTKIKGEGQDLENTISYCLMRSTMLTSSDEKHQSMDMIIYHYKWTFLNWIEYFRLFKNTLNIVTYFYGKIESKIINKFKYCK